MVDKPLGKTEAEMEINFSALKKHDENIQHIIDTASSVAHYKFNSSSGVWEKTDVEGSLFLYSRKTSPYVIIFIMNRLNKDNAKLTLSPEMEFKVQEPFLLCKASNSEIIGIWFYDCGECRRFGALLGRFHALSKDERSLQISIMMEAQKKTKEQNSPRNGLMGMFKQAQNEYTKARLKFAQEQKMQPKSNSSQQKKEKDSSKQKRIPFNRGISEPNLKLNPKTKTIEQLERKSPGVVDDKEEQMRKQRERFLEGHKEQDVLYNLIHGSTNTMPHNRAFSSDFELSLSGRDRSKENDNLLSTAGDLATFNDAISKQNFVSNHNVKEKAIDCAELESQFCKQINLANGDSTSSQTESLDCLHAISGTVVSNMMGDISHAAIASTLSSKPNDMLQVQGSRTAKPVVTNNANISVTTGISLNSAVGILNSTPSSSSTVSNSNFTNLTNHLLSPHVMISSKGRGTTLTNLASGQQNFSLAANFNKQGNKVLKKSPDNDKTDSKCIFPEAPSGAALKSLMAPAAFQVTSPNVNKNDGESGNNTNKSEKYPVISKKEFQNILLNMIQTDNEFVTRLHNAFLEKLPQQ